MRVLVLQHAKENIRGQISRYMQEIRPFVFVGDIGKKVADGVWDMVCEQEGVDAVFVEPCKGEQSYSVRTFNNPDYEPVLFDNILLFGRRKNIEKDLFEKLKGKTDIRKGLLAHSIETAVIAREMILNGFLKGIFMSISQKAGVDFFDLVSLATFVASIHDIGKIHPDFQYELARSISAFFPEEVGYLSFLEGNKLLNKEYDISEKIHPCRHEKYGHDILKERLFKKDPYFSLVKETPRGTFTNVTNIGKSIAKVVLYHHEGKGDDYSCITDKNDACTVWEAVQDKFYNIMRSLYLEKEVSFQNKDETDMFFYVLLGIVCMSDFLASSGNVYSKDTFENTDDVDLLKAYDEKCAYEAREFIRRNGFGEIAIKNPETFRELFSDFDCPRPMQEKMEELFQEYDSNDISFIIVEDVCGSGKTEAGLYGMTKMICNKNGYPGLYFGMPTEATAEASLQRYKDYCKNIGFTFKPEFCSGKSFLVENNPDVDQEEMESWLNTHYFKLLFPFSIGTIDQVMRGVRNEKYNLIRFNGVMSKGLLLDEIHAYDSYMINIIGKLLRYCFWLDNPVVMMSATLPSKTKRELILSATGNEYTPIEGYPLVTIVLKDGTVAQHEVPCWYESKTCSYKMLPYMLDTDSITSHLLSISSDGGCVGCILNTVDDAINVYSKIMEEKDDDLEVYLYHGRYFENDKEEKTKEISYLFGEKGKEEGNRPKRAIVVATQILEQSIDVDFDYMCVMLSPIDSVLQRMGRMWRHDPVGTYREAHKIECPLYIYTPEEVEKDYGVSGKRIYSKSVLEETWRVLKDCNGKLILPRDTARIVNEVYNNATIKDRSMYADVGNIKIQKADEFTMDGTFVSGDLAASRYSEYDTIKIIMADPFDYDRVAEENVDKDLYFKLLKYRAISIPEYNRKYIGNKYVRGTGFLRDYYVLPCHNEGDVLVSDNDGIKYDNRGLSYMKDDIKISVDTIKEDFVSEM